MTEQTEKDDIWKDDLLNRQHDALLLQRFLTGRIEERRQRGSTASYVLNLDAGWGQGKTFFLQRLKKQLEANSYKVAYVNAWEDDHAEDPLLAVAKAIEQAFPSGATKTSAKKLTKFAGRVALTAGQHTLKSLATKVIGQEGTKAVGEALTAGSIGAAEYLIDVSSQALGEQLVKRFEEGRKVVTDFRKKLEKLVSDEREPGPLFILVDELDRCRPTYAISLLERIKHLFEVNGVIFIVATDTEQLRHSIGAVYGAGFDGNGYLLRFFDRTYRFAKPERRLFVKHLFDLYTIDKSKLSSPPNDDHEEFFALMSDAYNLDLRDIERCFDILHSSSTLWNNTFRLELLYLLPLIFCYCKNSSETFKAIALCETNSTLLRSSPSGFSVTFKRDRRNGPAWPDAAYNINSLFKTFIDRARRPLGTLMNETPSDHASFWVKRMFVLELNERPNAHDELSLVRSYPELVRNVGRLSREAKS